MNGLRHRHASGFIKPVRNSVGTKRHHRISNHLANHFQSICTCAYVEICLEVRKYTCDARFNSFFHGTNSFYSVSNRFENVKFYKGHAECADRAKKRPLRWYQPKSEQRFFHTRFSGSVASYGHIKRPERKFTGNNNTG